MIPKYEHFSKIGSTHTYALENGARLEDGTVISADFQTEGRGRLGRTWSSSDGKSLLISILLKPKITPEEASLITPILALATTDILADFGVNSSIRWPNDVMVGDNKIGGILAEASLDESWLSHVVASLGLNVGQSMDELSKIDRPATSILLETGRSHDPSDLLKPLMDQFSALYESFLSSGFKALVDRWRKKMQLVGEDVLIDLGGNAIEGRVASFGNDGSIVLRDSEGKLKSFHSGEIVRLIR